MFYHANSGLDLTMYGAYNPVIGRWLSRDPLGETSDPQGNLYAYVGGDPISRVDPLRLMFGPSSPDGLPSGPFAPGGPYAPQNSPGGGQSCIANGDNNPQPLQLAANDGTQGNNQAQKKQFRDVVNKLGLTPDQARQLHDEISGKNYNYHEILQIGIDVFGK